MPLARECFGVQQTANHPLWWGPVCMPRPCPTCSPLLTSVSLICSRSYTVDGDNLSPSADTVLLDNSYLPAAFAADFSSAPWTQVAPFKETCSVRVGNMTGFPFAASGEWGWRPPRGWWSPCCTLLVGRSCCVAGVGTWKGAMANALTLHAAAVLPQVPPVAWAQCSTLWARTARSLTTRSAPRPMA